jgi:hypothetical protein
MFLDYMIFGKALNTELKEFMYHTKKKNYRGEIKILV